MGPRRDLVNDYVILLGPAAKMVKLAGFGSFLGFWPGLGPG